MRWPASAIEWRADSAQCGSKACIRARPRAAHASTTSAAIAAITIAAVEIPRARWVLARAGARAPCGCAVSPSVPVTGVTGTAGAVAPEGAVAVEGAIAVAGAVAVVGTVAAAGAVAVVGTVAVAGAVAVVGTVAAAGTVAAEDIATVAGGPTAQSSARASASASAGRVQEVIGMLMLAAGSGVEQLADRGERVAQHLLGGL
jgi:hypothetical protein